MGEERYENAWFEYRQVTIGLYAGEVEGRMLWRYAPVAFLTGMRTAFIPLRTRLDPRYILSLFWMTFFELTRWHVREF
jgi:hypothetical protein